MLCRFAPLLLAAYAASTATAAPLPPYASGNFYDPQHSGHGVNVEVIDDERAIVYWSVYDHEGDPMPLYMEGRIEDNHIRGTAYAPHGMRFGEFDRGRLQVPVWGELELTFQSCARATLKYSSSTGFGTGEIPLQRLALNAWCRGGHLLPAGELHGRIHYGYDAVGVVDGLVMPDGSLWATAPTVHEPDNYGFAIDTSTRALVAPQASGTPERVLSEARLLPNGFLCEISGTDCSAEEAEGVLLEFQPSLGGMTANVPSDGAMLSVALGTFLPGYDRLRGIFEFDADGRAPGRWQMVIGANGDLCVRVFRTTDCLYTGSIVRTGDEPYTFELRRAGRERVFRGVIVVDFEQVFIGPYRLRFIGSDGETGLAINARAELRS
jgi:hypothetical protein